MILDGGLVASGDEDEFLDSGCRGLFHRILDQRLVDHRQHFLRHRLGGWKEPCSEAANRKDGFLDHQVNLAVTDRYW